MSRLPVNRLLSDTVTQQQRSGVDNAGDPTYGAQTTLRARVEHVSKLVVRPDGSEVVADHKVVSEVEIPRSALVWLPGDDTTKVNEARQPITVVKASTPDGIATLYETWM